MTKSSVYTPREQEVLDSPDYFVIRVFQYAQGWIESKPFSAREALTRDNNIKQMNQNYRASLYAARQFEDGVRLANVTPAHLSALVELNAAQ